MLDARDWCDTLRNNIDVLNKIEQDKRNDKQKSILEGGSARLQDESRGSISGQAKMNFMLQNPEILRRKFLDILAENNHQVLAFYRLALNYDFEDGELLIILGDLYARINPR